MDTVRPTAPMAGSNLPALPGGWLLRLLDAVKLASGAVA
jgi:hypothetical protein